MNQQLNLISIICLFLHCLCSVNGSAEFAYERGLKWCDTFCLCPQDGIEKISCMEPSDIYAILNFNDIQIMRLMRVQWNPISQLKWCNSGQCFCNRETDKLFDCMDGNSVLGTFIDDAAQSLSLQQTYANTTEYPSVRVAGVLPFENSETDDPAERTDTNDEEDAYHRRRDSDEDRRNRRRNRKNRKNRRRNRNDEDSDDESIGSDQFLLAEDAESFDYPESNMLPKQEAINSNPMVTAMQPPTRRQPIYHPTTQASAVQHKNHNRHNTNPVHPTGETMNGPMVQESSHPDIQQQNANLRESQDNGPTLEVPIQRKTVAGRVSEDLRQITEDVQHIRSDVVFNQRILLVTVGVAGVAMLGVLVLALHACCSKRSSTRRARITDNGRLEDSSNHHHHHPSSTVTKVNINEAW